MGSVSRDFYILILPNVFTGFMCGAPSIDRQRYDFLERSDEVDIDIEIDEDYSDMEEGGIDE